jgi:hypothetical protein
VKIVPRREWTRQQWGSLRAMSLPAPELWVHHGASGSATLATLRAYERFHVVQRGWAGLGYSFAIVGDGTVYEGRGWGRQGAHTSGRNHLSHGVCLVGDWTSGTVPGPMVEALVWLVREGHRVGALRTPTITGGHRDAPGASTACPGWSGVEAIQRARALLTSPPAKPAPPPVDDWEQFTMSLTDREKATLRQLARLGEDEARDVVSAADYCRRKGTSLESVCRQLLSFNRTDGGSGERQFVQRLKEAVESMDSTPQGFATAGIALIREARRNGWDVDPAKYADNIDHRPSSTPQNQ